MRSMIKLTSRLRGCPNGATRDALLACGHTVKELSAAVKSGRVIRQVRNYVNPKAAIEWYMIVDPNRRVK